MKILIVSATEEEIAPLIKMFHRDWVEAKPGTFVRNQATAEVLITGVGMIRTSFSMGKALSRSKPDLCINAGIAGAFPGKLEIGDVVHVVRDCLPEMGATAADGSHLAMRDLDLQEDISSTEGLINAAAGAFDFLPRVTGITVNTVHGDIAGITRSQALVTAEIETMESAAFFYCCIKEGVPFVAIRAISNIVEPRDKAKWDISLAVTQLNTQLSELLGFLVA